MLAFRPHFLNQGLVVILLLTQPFLSLNQSVLGIANFIIEVVN